MSSKGKVPDAWDDDWVNAADTSEATSAIPAQTSKKLSKAERRAQQAEFNRKIWQEAEAENANYFVESRASVPLQSSFKPNVTVLSRKPGPTAIAKKDATAGVEQLSIQDDEDDEGGQARPKTPTPEERALKAQREREKKQKKYDEARERLFGVPAASPGSTPPRSGTPVRGSASERGKGRGRGGGAKDSKENKDSRPTSSASGKAKQLFDPSYAPKPDSAYLQRKEAVESGGAPPMEEQIIRTPKGPDGSGRGGFGFVRRGDKAS